MIDVIGRIAHCMLVETRCSRENGANRQVLLTVDRWSACILIILP